VIGARPESASRSPLGLSFSLHRAHEVGNLGALWRGLETRADASFYLSWDWMGRWLAEIGGDARVLIGRLGSEVVALGLLRDATLRRHGWLTVKALMLHQVGDPDIDVITMEYNGFLVDRAVGEAATRGALEFLKRSAGDGASGADWDELHLGGVADSFEPLARDTGMALWVQSRAPSWSVDLEAIRRSGRGYLAHVGASTRYQIRRALRLYEARGPVAATRAATVPDAMRFYAEMRDLHQRYWVARGEPGSYAFPFYEKFHRGLLADCLPRGTVELLRVAAGETVIGYVYNLVYRGWVCAYHTGLAYDADPRLKPGLVSHYLAIERHLAEGARVYDFLAGDNRYKANLGTPGPAMLHLALQRPRAKLQAESVLRRVKASLRSFAGDAAAKEERGTAG